MRLLAKLEPIRRWIDGGDVADGVDVIRKQETPRRRAEEFLIDVAREIGSVLDYEAFTPPGGLTYIPGEFIVFLSAEDDRDWLGAKRRGLQLGLTHALGQRARELFGRSQLSKSSFAIDLRVDGTLEKGQFRVMTIWDSDADKTFVASRRFANQPSVARGRIDDGEMTMVNARPRIVLYSLEVWRDSVIQTVFPVTKPEVTIGRGSQFVQVDLQIKGDPEMSRLHAVIRREANGICWLIGKGQNSVFVHGRKVPCDERVQVKAGDEITISNFLLRIQ